MKKSIVNNILGLCLFYAAASPAFAQSAARPTLHVPSEVPLFEFPKRLPDAINSEVEETMPILSQDGKTLFFVRVLHPDNTGGRVSGHDIWSAARNEDGSWQQPKNSFLSLNNKGNNAIMGFNQEGNRVYLLNKYGNGPSFKSGVSYADFSGAHWEYPKEMEIPKIKKDGFFYNAYLTPDEEVLIISMKQRGQPGDEDLYISVREQDGNWSKLQNMGAKINSEGFEAFPFLTADKQTLYFSSNGHGGHGDADIFMTTRQDESWNNWSKPVNLGKPVNSKGFDAAFALYTDSTAFFVSNRSGGMADIYQTRIAKPRVPGEPRMPIVFQELTENEMEALKPTDEDNSMADLTDSRKEAIVVEDVYPLKVSIYFAFDSYVLSPEAQDKLKELFLKYTDGHAVKVELTGHTDAIGTESYNRRLSVNRAISAEEFLRQAGLAQERVYTQGKGEAEPVATNDTPEGRRQNRRVSIMVVK